MKKYLLLILLPLLSLRAIGAGAVTVDVSPRSAYIGDSVTVTATISFNVIVTPPSPNNTSLTIDFGDGSPVERKTNFNPSATGTFSVTHSYAEPGTYTVTATGTGHSPGVTVQPPAVATTNVTVSDVLADEPLPRGEVGLDYSYRFQTTTGRYSYQLVKGSLPPGLVMDSKGLISGIPIQKGAFSFTVRLRNGAGQVLERNRKIIVDPGQLTIVAEPEHINLTVGGMRNLEVRFKVTFPKVAINETVRSGRGEFIVGGRVAGYNNVPLSLNLAGKSPSASERVNLPRQVLETAQRLGTNKVMYRRTFTARNLLAGHAESQMTLRSPATGELRITSMRIYFAQNNRSMILVERNSRDLTGVVEIHYNGSGELRGFWKVGERILQRVQKHLFYGRVITLKTPSVPPLPTFSEGAHHLQFIITSPETAAGRIDFPEAIYNVEARRAQFVAPIRLSAPAAGARLEHGDTEFSWSDIPRISRYSVEFFRIDGMEEEGKPFFTASTRQPRYRLARVLLRLRFTPGESYRWRVRGFNAKEELAAESGEREFLLLRQDAYVPGQVIFLVDDSDTGRERLKRIAEKYTLRVVDVSELPSLGHLMVLCETDGRVSQVVSRLNGEDGLYHSQPNFVFHTLTNAEPLSSMQEINSVVDLENIQHQATGAGILVGVIDTGIDLEHQDLRDRIEKHFNFVESSQYQGEIHGTAVAGIIAASRNNAGILGIAPEARLLAMRACEQEKQGNAAGKCYSSSVAKALDQSITERAHIVNLSFGIERSDRLVGELLVKAKQQGMVLVAPVGNDPEATEPLFPASHDAVIGVAGFARDGQPLPNLILARAASAAAPADSVFTAVPGNHHNFVDGTSYAAATISGLIALSLDFHRGKRMGNLPHFDTYEGWKAQVARFFE